MPECPWYVSAHAVRRYIEITGGRQSFDDARNELIEYCARVWLRYADGARKPGLTRTGAYVYRGPGRGRGRLQVIVSVARRPEGPKDQVVDVIGEGEGEDR